MLRYALVIVVSTFGGLVVASGHAQELRFAVKGVVVDQPGAVISQAEVVFKGEAGTIISHTDVDGSVGVSLEPGKYLVTISAHGFLTTTVADFLVPRPTADPFRISLQVDPTPLERTDRYHEDLTLPMVSSELPNVIKDEPPTASLPVAQPAATKHRSMRCLYLWKCSSS